MKKLLGVLAPAVLLVAAPALAQDLAGSWDITSSTFLPDQKDPCVYSGSGAIEQSDGTLSGDVTLDLESGPEPPCPATMEGTLSGTVGDGSVSGTITGELGSLTFSGSTTTEVTMVAKADVEMVEGDQSVQSGPFTGAGGTWSAMIMAPVSALPPGAVALLALLVAGAATFVLRRRRA